MTYALPKAVHARLVERLQPFKNKQAALSLAAFLGRYWTAPSKLGHLFHIARESLAQHSELNLTENRVRGAIKTLMAIGFIETWPPKGSSYRKTSDGLQRKPSRFSFAPEFNDLFNKANAAIGKAVQAVVKVARSLMPASRPQPSMKPAARPMPPKNEVTRKQAPADIPLHIGEKLSLSSSALKAIGLAGVR